MSEFKNREKRKALLFITLGMMISMFSYQNFQYPEHLRKSSVDLSTGLQSSDLEIQRTRQNLQPQVVTSPGTQVVARTQVVTKSQAPMKLRLKRAPATRKKNAHKTKKKKPKKKPSN